MANNKFSGYTPKKDETTQGWDNKTKVGNRLDLVNPYEFRKGMDYELTDMGCSRLQESTTEEREKATEKVLKNLNTHDGYYTSLITYETLFRNVQGSKPSFKSWLKEQDNTKMQEIKRGDKDSKHKDDKMEEPKYKKEDYTTTFQTTALKEAVKYKLQRKLLAEAKKEKDEDDELDKKAGKGAKKGSKKLSKFDREREAIQYCIEDLKEKKEKELEKYKSSKKDKKAVENYKKAIELSEKDKKKLEKTAEKFDVPSKEYIAKDIPGTIKDLEKRLKAIDKDEEVAVAKLREEKNEIAATDMTREEQIRLLNILKEKGVSLREGSDSIKVYYEIAKTAFLEGLSKGMGI